MRLSTPLFICPLTNEVTVCGSSAFNEYNMMLREQEDQNRMKEALVLYTSIVTSQYFLNTPAILFFNKIDILRKKCKAVPSSPKQNISLYFPEYTGDPANWKEVFRFLERMFLSVHKEHRDAKIRNKKVYSNMCTAVDQENMRAVLGSVVRSASAIACKAGMG